MNLRMTKATFSNTASMAISFVFAVLLLSGCGSQVDLERGKEVVTANCKVCHAQGINGAPIIGNSKMWGKRITKGQPALVANAISGVGLMPAKGVNPELSNTEIELAVAYFVSQIEN